eukprot:TRINITY_DN14024_c0_g1_i1.p1 TRINITY_DN14024_c0_g1~~TRINITY_DN14024_c0_g1_i1.p1  ORF type:complete len:564 (+),score=86.47 TRINITY_DN14024_c0_g1_i1:74-1765(+)
MKILNHDDEYQLLEESYYEDFSSIQHLSESELDLLLHKLYRYFFDGGYFNILMKDITAILSYLFTLLVFFILLYVINWNHFATCSDSQDCAKGLIDSNFVAKINFFGYVFIIIFLFYIFYRLFILISDVFRYYPIRNIFLKMFKIPSSDMSTLKWFEVSTRIVEVGLCADDLEVSQRIMRRDNYMIALINNSVLHLPFLTSMLELKILSFVLLGQLFDRNRTIDPSILISKRLQVRIWIFSLLLLIISPFMLLFQLFYYFLSYFETIKADTSILTARTWSPMALYLLREYNELPHHLYDRLRQAHRVSTLYFQSFPSQSTSILTSFFTYIFGSICGILAIISLVFADQVSKIEILGRSLPWLLGTFIVPLAGLLGARVSPSEPVLDSNGNAIFDSPEHFLKQIVLKTHYFPSRWKITAMHKTQIRDEFNQLFQPRYKNFLGEFFAPIITPIVLMFYTSKDVDLIIKFIKEFSTYQVKLGSVCIFSSFSLDEIKTVDEINLTLYNKEKVEKSVLQFMLNHPSWESRSENFIKDFDSFYRPQFSPKTTQTQDALYFSILHDIETS